MLLGLCWIINDTLSSSLLAIWCVHFLQFLHYALSFLFQRKMYALLSLVAYN